MAIFRDILTCISIKSHQRIENKNICRHNDRLSFRVWGDPFSVRSVNSAIRDIINTKLPTIPCGDKGSFSLLLLSTNFNVK